MKRFPWRASLYLWVVALAAGGGLAGWLVTWPAQPAADGAPEAVPLFGATVLLAVLAQHVPLQLGPRRKRDLSAGVHFAALLHFGPPLAVAAAGAGHLLGQGLLALRRDPASGHRRATRRSVLFNTSQVMLAAAAGGVAYFAILPPVAPASLDRVEDLWALPAAAAAMYLTNSLLVAGMAGLQLGRSPLRIWREGLRVGPLASTAPYLAGLTGVLTARYHPLGPVAVVLLLVAVQQALLRAQRLLEAERAARSAAEAAARDRTEFLQVAAHELRTPLTGLRGYAELLRRNVGDGRPADPHRARRAAEVIGRQAEQLAGLVAQLLDAAHLESGATGQGPTGATAMDVTDRVTMAVAAPAADGKVRFTPGAPHLTSAPAPLFDRVLQSLVEHAVKHSPPGELVDVAVLGRPDGMTEVTIRDRGPALAHSERGRLFEAYYNADEARHADGTGLGLYLSRRIVTAFGGVLEVEAPPDGGAKLVLLLPPPVRAHGAGVAATRALVRSASQAVQQGGAASSGPSVA